MGHWYDSEGNPRHFIVGKNGNERATTLRDARKENLFPSVTEILNMAAKPALTNWLVEQALLSALTLPKVEGESLDDYKKRAKQDSTEQTKQAMETGSAIHADIEAVWKDEPAGTWREIAELVKERTLEVTGFEDGWIAEKSFSHNGYGGMCDLHHPGGWVIDYKTKDFGPEDMGKKMAWDEHAMQLAAYAHGLGMANARMANVFVSRNNPGLIVWHVWEERADEGSHYEKFLCLLKYWQLTKNYQPNDDIPF